jgi:hypothetical protein
MMKEMGLSVVRHVLSGVAGYLVAKGVVDAGSAEAISGGLFAAVALALSYVDKRARAA